MAEPMTAAQLIGAIRAEGVVAQAHTGWTTYERDQATGKPFGPVHGVVMHHTGGLNDMSVIWNGRAGLPGPLAHAFVAKSGVVTMISAGRSNHAGGGDRDVLNAVITESYMSRPPAPRYGEGDPGAYDGNDVFYGFECENLGAGDDPWPQAQYIAMVRCAAAICRHYQWSEKSVIGHLEWSNQKNDPKGFSMVTFRADLKLCLAARPGQWPTKPQETALQLDTATIDAIAQRVWAYMHSATDKHDMHQSVRTTEDNSAKALAKLDQVIAALTKPTA